MGDIAKTRVTDAHQHPDFGRPSVLKNKVQLASVTNQLRLGSLPKPYTTQNFADGSGGLGHRFKTTFAFLQDNVSVLPPQKH